MNRYSLQEIKLFTALGFDYLIEVTSIEPPTLYRMAAEQAFLNNVSGPAIEALRRGLTAITKCQYYRMTPEFEALISFTEGEMDTKLNVKALLKAYFDLQTQIHEHFGYKEDWVSIPLDDQTDQYWMVIEDRLGGGRYAYSPTPFNREMIEAGTEIYGGWIYTQRFLPKWVYRAENCTGVNSAEDCTMVCADTKTDGNKFLMVFDNEKECKDEELKKLYMKHWGMV
jgi:hypothetical protein